MGIFVSITSGEFRPRLASGVWQFFHFLALNSPASRPFGPGQAASSRLQVRGQDRRTPSRWAGILQARAERIYSGYVAPLDASWSLTARWVPASVRHEMPVHRAGIRARQKCDRNGGGCHSESSGETAWTRTLSPSIYFLRTIHSGAMGPLNRWTPLQNTASPPANQS